MKKILPLIVVGFLVLSGLRAVALPNDDTEYEAISVEFSQPKIANENQFVTIGIDETNSILMNENKPMLPSYRHTFTFPAGTKIKSVSCTPSNIQQQTLSKNIAPTPQAFSVCIDEGIKKTKAPNADYNITWISYIKISHPMLI